MPPLRLGRLRLSHTAARRLALGAGAAAVAGGFWLGVATAADPADQLAAGTIPGPPPGTSTPAGPGGPDRAVRQPAAWPRRPLHRLIAARVLRPAGAAEGRLRASPAQHLLVGRLVELGPNSALVSSGPGQTRQVRLTPQTRLPARRPKPGDPVLVIGRSADDGTFLARAVLLRPLRPREASAAPLRALSDQR